MSRKLSLATLALGAMLLAVPLVAQQPDTAKATTTMAKHHAKKHTKAAKKTMAKPAEKDSTKK
jgi:hypothetical protein